MSLASFSRRTGLAVVMMIAVQADDVLAAPCSGFTDVLSTSSFCTNVNWLKNRAITLGCTSTTLFCPGDEVPRLQMAAFLNRLGNALAPVQWAASASGSNDLNLDAGETICALPPIAITGVPRSLLLDAVIHVGPTSGSADVRPVFVQSTNGGATWTPISSSNSPTTRTPGATASMSVQSGAAISSPTTYRFGVQVLRTTTATNLGASGPWRCEVRAEAENYKLLNNGPDPAD